MKIICLWGKFNIIGMGILVRLQKIQIYALLKLHITELLIWETLFLMNCAVHAY